MNKNINTTSRLNLKTLLALFLLSGSLAGLALAPASAQAAETFQAAGYTGPGPDLLTVQQALTMNDDSIVALKGKIVKNLGDDHYLFQDATGTIEIDIDDDAWRGQQVGPEDLVLVSGEVDRDWTQITIDVESLVKQ